MKSQLPADLFQAEILLTESLFISLENQNDKFYSINLLFDNLRLNPILSRLVDELYLKGINFYLIWSDEGATALAKRDIPNFSNNIYSYSSFLKDIDNLNQENILIAIKPEPYDFDQFKQVCDLYEGKIFMINGRLEDLAVGIGNLGRERRKEFISLWKTIFWLQPLTKGAIMKLNKQKWQLFRLDVEGYRFCDSFDIKPDDETILESFRLNK